MLNTGVKQTAKKAPCYHCGATCPDDSVRVGDKPFCCNGCRTVYEFLSSNKLGEYYADGAGVGTRPEDSPLDAQFAYLDDPEVVKRLVDYQDDQIALIRLHLPAIHCSSCVYLLEHLYSIQPGVLLSEVNFSKRELKLKFDQQKVSLREIVSLLTRIGYPADFNLSHLNKKAAASEIRGLYLRMGTAGFAFGNIMLFAFPEYLGLTDPSLRQFFGYFSLLLAFPVLAYSASYYFQAAYESLKIRRVSIDLPIALGISTLFIQSFYEIIWRVGQGYLDSMSGLVFFLLVGRLFQKKTYDHLSFERDYEEYFPIAVLLKDGETERTVPLTALKVGDRIIVRHNELIPADSRLVQGRAVIDYSFVTGESAPREINSGQTLYAGGRQLGGGIELEVETEVASGFLTSLWSSQPFKSDNKHSLTGLIDRIAGLFTPIILLIATGSGLYWLGDSMGAAVNAFSSVLIVACPCALALSGPFAWGTALRLMGKSGLYLKNHEVVERLSTVTDILFDKTGTLSPSARPVTGYDGPELSDYERGLIGGLAAHSTHPLSRALAEHLGKGMMSRVEQFEEHPGLGLEGIVAGVPVRIGQPTWIDPGQTQELSPEASHVGISLDQRYRGKFAIARGLREATPDLIEELRPDYRMAVLSGDNPSERASLVKLFGDRTDLKFDQSPHDKLEYVNCLEKANQSTLMIGDGLNDAGALKAATVGMALTENTAAFSPACDAIMEASRLSILPRFLKLAKSGRNVIIASVGISFIYNLIGLSLAVSGRLSPLLAAILMPLSSITVVSFATLSIRWQAKRKGIRQ